MNRITRMKKKKKLNPVHPVILSIILILISVSAYAAEKKEYKWKIDDLVTTDSVQEYHISPPGKQLVWTVKQWDLKTHTHYHTIYLTALDKKGEDLRLTRGTNTYTNLQWVPGETKISFMTDRTFKNTKPGNLWVLPLTGGDPYPVTGFEKGIYEYRWLDAKNLLFTAPEPDTLLEKKRAERKDTTWVVEDDAHPGVTRLFTYNLETKKVTRLTRNRRPLTLLSLSPDKKYVLYRLSMSVYYFADGKVPQKFYLMEPATGESREILSHMRYGVFLSYFSWERDGGGFYFTYEHNTHPITKMYGVVKIYHYDLSSHTAREVDLQWDRYAAGMKSVGVTAGGFLAQLADGARFKFAHYRRTGRTGRSGGGGSWKREFIDHPHQRNIDSFTVAPDGKTLVYRFSTASRPPRYYLAGLKGNGFKKEREVMDIKSPLFERPLARTEIRTWTGAEDETVEGILYYPYNYEPGKKYPLIVMIHGGPHAADMDTFRDSGLYPAHLWCERGVFVLKPNYHGSSNYGLDFARSIVGRYYEYEIPDIEAGVDMLIAEGKVDKERLGVQGHSNGSVLGAALIVYTPRYKAACLSAGDVNWTSDYGNSSYGAFFGNYYFGGPPWEKPGYYTAISPLFRMARVTTPTLIAHGDRDSNVPYSQAWEFYRALQAIGKAPVRFLSLPGEGHMPRKPAHKRRMLEESIAWFETYLFNKRSPKNEFLKKGSPLDMLDKVRAIARENGRYGIKRAGVLIPEVVEYSKYRVGRFEVTRAQWAAYDKNFSYDAGTGNYPVTGISYERAKAYVQWLSRLTGETYRLPTEKEAEALYKKPSGNTFDRWADYAVNPGDYTNLLKELKRYNDKPVLLKPVGSFPAGSGDGAPVFDLGGNAAEWITLPGGKGKPAGGSAVTPEDTRGEQKPPQHYIGFRVIEENLIKDKKDKRGPRNTRKTRKKKLGSILNVGETK